MTVQKRERLGARRALSKVQGQLEAGEDVVASVRATRTMRPGVLVLTDRRVIFAATFFVFVFPVTSVKQFRYEHISGVAAQPQPWGASVRLATALGGAAAINVYDAERAESIKATIQTRIGPAREAASP